MPIQVLHFWMPPLRRFRVHHLSIPVQPNLMTLSRDPVTKGVCAEVPVRARPKDRHICVWFLSYSGIFWATAQRILQGFFGFMFVEPGTAGDAGEQAEIGLEEFGPTRMVRIFDSVEEAGARREWIVGHCLHNNQPGQNDQVFQR
jgi:hypothetical protein